MRKICIGELQVDAVVEDERAELPFDRLLPDASVELLTAEAPHLGPAVMDLPGRCGILSMHSYLIRTPRCTVLVDTCIGNDKDRNGFALFHMRSTGWLDKLRAAGVAPAQVDYVMCTHMHADHVGWNTRLVDGRWVPTFPNARYVFARREFEHRDRAWRLDPADPMLKPHVDSVLPVVEAGQALLVDSDYELDGHFLLEPAPGHTPGNVIIRLASRGERAVLSGDVIHHPLQVKFPEFSPLFCDDRAESARYRRRFVERFADQPDIILPAHFPHPTAGRIVTRGPRWDYVYID